MVRCKRKGGRTTSTSVLAAVAREFSATDNWQGRVAASLDLLRERMPGAFVAAGLQLNGHWSVIFSGIEDADSTCALLKDHLRILSAAGAIVQADSESSQDLPEPVSMISEEEDFPGSYFSLPVDAGPCAGVLHACSSEPDYFSPDDLEMLQVAASQLGLYLRSVPAALPRAAEAGAVVSSQWETGQCIGSLDTLVDVLADAVTVFDTNNTAVKSNAVVINELGFDPCLMGLKNTLKLARIRHPDGTPVSLSNLTTSRALRGEMVVAEPLIIRAADGTDRQVISSASPIFDKGRIVGAFAAWRDITEQTDARLRRERHLGRLKRLLSDSADILAAHTLEAVLGCVAATAADLMGASAAVCAYGVSEDGFDCHACAPDFARADAVMHDTLARLREAVRVAENPSGGVVRTRGPVGDELILGVPLTVFGERLDGMLLVAGPSSENMGEEDAALLEHLGVIASLRLRSLELQSSAEKRAAEAEEARRILDALLNYGPDGIMITDAPDAQVRAISKEGMRLLGHEDADYSRVDAQVMLRSGVALHQDGSAPVCIDELPAYRALHGENITNEEWLIARRDGERIPILCSAGPIMDSSGRGVGSIVTYRDVTDVKTAQQALQAAYERDHHISEVLQQALLPPISQDAPLYQICAEYHSAMVEAEVGGDFYDVFEIGGGWLALVLGDVSGKGLSAAVYTSMAKYMIRAYAFEDPEPDSVMRRLNDALLDFVPDDTFITIFYALYDSTRGILAYANAGHEPPIVWDHRLQACTCLDVTGPAVGIGQGRDFGQRVTSLSPGSALVVYTDGITDSRVGTDFFGMDGLARVLLENASEGSSGIADAVYRAAVSHSRGLLADDAALLVLKAKSRVASGSSAR